MFGISFTATFLNQGGAMLNVYAEPRVRNQHCEVVGSLYPPRGVLMLSGATVHSYMTIYATRQ